MGHRILEARGMRGASRAGGNPSLTQAIGDCIVSRNNWGALGFGRISKDGNVYESTKITGSDPRLRISTNRAAGQTLRRSFWTARVCFAVKQERTNERKHESKMKWKSAALLRLPRIECLKQQLVELQSCLQGTEAIPLAKRWRDLEVQGRKIFGSHRLYRFIF